MLRIERVGKHLLAFRNLRQRPIAEFYDLSDFIVNSPDEFFGEIGERVFLIGTHAKIGKTASSTVDLLGVDSTGAAVAAVIEAAAEDSALSRAITAASKLASWEPMQFFTSLNPQRTRALRAFLGSALPNLNKRQRVFIIGEKVDEELTAAAVWLQERGVDIVFVEAALGLEPQSGAEYLNCRAFRSQDVHPSKRALNGEGSSKKSAEAGSGIAEPEKPAENDPHPPVQAPPEAPDRRSVQREILKFDRVVEIEYAGRRLGAYLSDYSEVGVALEMNSPLPIGSTVTVIGELDSPHGLTELNRRGRVRYCRFDDQVFRLGVAFEQTPA
jgi:hypothetical protein